MFNTSEFYPKSNQMNLQRNISLLINFITEQSDLMCTTIKASNKFLCKVGFSQYMDIITTNKRIKEQNHLCSQAD